MLVSFVLLVYYIKLTDILLRHHQMPTQSERVKNKLIVLNL